MTSQPITASADLVRAWLDAMPPELRAQVQPSPGQDTAPTTRDQITTWLAEMPPITRAVLCRVLAENATVFAALHHTAISEANRAAESIDAVHAAVWLAEMPATLRAQLAPLPPYRPADGHVPTTLAAVKAWLASFEPITRAVLCRVLAENATVFAALRRFAIYEATMTAPYDEVAAQLGVSTAAINKAVSEHRKAAGAPSRRRRPTPAANGAA